jgi:hypothetical protein
MRRGTWPLGVFLVASLGFASTARADGGLFVEVVDVGPAETQAEVVADGRLSSNLQRALYVATDDGCWDSYVQPGSIAVAGAAWLLPLPSVPTEIAEDSEGVLEQVDAATRPVLRTETQRVRLIEHDGGHWGMCGGSGTSGGDAEPEPVADPATRSDWPLDPVWVRATGSIGAVDYEVLTAASAEALATWLASHGYASPDGLVERVEPYVERGWAFFAARVRNEAREARALPTFRFRLCGFDEFVPVTYPMRLTTLSMGEALDFVILVAGTEWVPYSGDFSHGNFEPVAGFSTHRDELHVAPAGEGGCSDEPLATRYDDHLAASLGSVTARDEYGDVHTALVRQFAKVLTADDVAARAALVDAEETTLEAEASWTAPLARMVSEGLWLTRWRGRATPETMDVDVVFEPARADSVDDGVLTEHCLVDAETGEQVNAWGGVSSLTDRSRAHERQASSISLLLGATLLGLAVRRGRW